MDAFSAQRRYPAVHGQVGGIVLLSKETCTVGKPIPLCPGDLKHCIVILKRSSVVQRHIKNTALLNNEWDRGRDGSEKVARDIKSGHCDPKKWACFSIRTFSNERPWAVSLFRKGIHCVLKCLRRSIDRFEALLCSLKRHGVCWTAGKRNPRWRGEGGGVKTILFSLYRSLKLYGCPTRGLKDRLVVWKPVLLVKVLKIFMDSFKPLFCCVDGCIFCSEKVSCCPWTGWRHCIVE
ncbi:hypothetical protein TNCT_663811 [Trichonephila clavata]|uniref:Uncharacterized protein n=1 Tax=Trichonephila clavata TaxID=2740835 RepID=A0A8X6KUX7_TRICU|nr:hypothetical protein TNCT_663811 [Trichonephila clavata]